MGQSELTQVIRELKELKALKLLDGLRAASTESQKRLFLEWESKSKRMTI